MLWNLRNFLEYLFLQNTSGGCFWIDLDFLILHKHMLRFRNSYIYDSWISSVWATRSIGMKLNFLQRQVLRNSFHLLDSLWSIKLHVLILFIVLFFQWRRVITYQITLKTVRIKQCQKHHTYLFYGLLIYLIYSSLLCMLTYVDIVCFLVMLITWLILNFLLKL